MESGKINSLTQIGIRALTPHQREQAKRFGVKMVEMKDFNDNIKQNQINEEIEGQLEYIIVYP